MRAAGKSTLGVALSWHQFGKSPQAMQLLNPMMVSSDESAQSKRALSGQAGNEKGGALRGLPEGVGPASPLRGGASPARASKTARHKGGGLLGRRAVAVDVAPPCDAKGSDASPSGVGRVRSACDADGSARGEAVLKACNAATPLSEEPLCSVSSTPAASNAATPRHLPPIKDHSALAPAQLGAPQREGVESPRSELREMSQRLERLEQNMEKLLTLMEGKGS